VWDPTTGSCPRADITTDRVQIVRERKAVSLSYFEDLVFAIAVEGGPADGWGFAVVAVVGGAPVERHGFALVTDLERSAFELKRQADNKETRTGPGTAVCPCAP
jgi:hypothetical protein